MSGDKSFLCKAINQAHLPCCICRGSAPRYLNCFSSSSPIVYARLTVLHDGVLHMSNVDRSLDGSSRCCPNRTSCGISGPSTRTMFASRRAGLGATEQAVTCSTNFPVLDRHCQTQTGMTLGSMEEIQHPLTLASAKTSSAGRSVRHPPFWLSQGCWFVIRCARCLRTVTVELASHSCFPPSELSEYITDQS